MGTQESVPRVYAKFEGKAKPGESKVLRHVMDVMDPGGPKTMLEEFM